MRATRRGQLRETAIMSEDAAKKRPSEAALKRDCFLMRPPDLPVFVLEMGSHLFMWVHMAVMNSIGMQNSWYLQFALTTLVLFGPGLRLLPQGPSGAGASGARHEQPGRRRHAGGLTAIRWSRPSPPASCRPGTRMSITRRPPSSSR
jgi:hypothetical protein